MSDLSDRQKDLLKAIIEIYVKTGEPVGSENIDKTHSLGVSPATIRHEMGKLTELGFLKQPHTSAGRIPTSQGFRLYIGELMKEKELPVSAEVEIREGLWQKRFQEHLLWKEAVKNLALRLQIIALVIDEDGSIFYAGAANILDWPEFEDIDVARFVLSLFDEYSALKQIIGRAVGVDPLHILFGEELGLEHLMPTSFVFCKFHGKDEKEGIVGVIGPARMNFPVVLPYIRFTGNLLEQALHSY